MADQDIEEVADALMAPHDKMPLLLFEHGRESTAIRIDADSVIIYPNGQAPGAMFKLTAFHPEGAPKLRHMLAEAILGRPIPTKET